MVFKAGTRAEAFMMQRWLSKGVKNIYVNGAEYRTYVAQNVTMASVISNLPNLQMLQKLTTIRDAGEALARELGGSPMSKEMYQHVRTISEAVVSLFSSSITMAAIIQELRRGSAAGVHHGMCVSIVAVMLALEMRWNNPVQIEKIAAAGFIHDIGESQLSETVQTTAIEKMTPEERENYQRHPKRGMDVIEGFVFIPEEVVKSVVQHHERADGSGFPSRLQDDGIHPMARIIAVANDFCNLIAEKDKRPAPNLSVFDALARLELESTKYNTDVLAALRRLIVQKAAVAA